MKKEFNLKTAKHMMELSDIAYFDQSSIDIALSEYNVTHIKNNETSTSLFIAEYRDYVVVVFCGSKDKKDFILDSDIDLYDFWYSQIYRSISVHHGFYRAYTSVKDEIKQKLELIKKPVFCTGHSLGGALATIFAIDSLILGFIKFKSCYTFGSPRIFSSNSADYLNMSMKNDFYRVVNNNDLVSRIPPEPIYSHIGMLKYFDDDGNFHNGEDLSWWKMKQFALDGIVNDIGESGLDAVKDHYQSSYIKMLSAQKKP